MCVSLSVSVMVVSWNSVLSPGNFLLGVKSSECGQRFFYRWDSLQPEVSTMQQASAVHPSVIRLKQLSVRVGLSRSTIYDRINPRSSRYDATFPKPFKLGSFAVGWLEEDVNAWLHRCASSSCVGANPN